MRNIPNIEKRGNSYRFTVSVGVDNTGKRLYKRETWQIPDGMTSRQAQNEARHQAELFEQKCRTGQALDGNITLSDFIDSWFADYGEKNLRAKTLSRYRQLVPRVVQAFGHIKLDKLQPHHIAEFYNNLSESGIREDGKFKAANNLPLLLQSSKITKSQLADKAGFSVTTVTAALHGNTVACLVFLQLNAASCSICSQYVPKNG
jgi:hypothetical protein